MTDVISFLLKFFLFFTALFLIVLILIQRGKGGGLAGAFGGMGGQSAFGTKAGDTFTKITMYVATFWIVLCVASVLLLASGPGVIDVGGGGTGAGGGGGEQGPLTPESESPGDGSGSNSK